MGRREDVDLDTTPDQSFTRKAINSLKLHRSKIFFQLVNPKKDNFNKKTEVSLHNSRGEAKVEPTFSKSALKTSRSFFQSLRARTKSSEVQDLPTITTLRGRSSTPGFKSSSKSLRRLFTSSDDSAPYIFHPPPQPVLKPRSNLREVQEEVFGLLDRMPTDSVKGAHLDFLPDTETMSYEEESPCAVRKRRILERRAATRGHFDLNPETRPTANKETGVFPTTCGVHSEGDEVKESVAAAFEGLVVQEPGTSKPFDADTPFVGDDQDPGKNASKFQPTFPSIDETDAKDGPPKEMHDLSLPSDPPNEHSLDLQSSNLPCGDTVMSPLQRPLTAHTKDSARPAALECFPNYRSSEAKIIAEDIPPLPLQDRRDETSRVITEYLENPDGSYSTVHWTNKNGVLTRSKESQIVPPPKHGLFSQAIAPESRKWLLAMMSPFGSCYSESPASDSSSETDSSDVSAKILFNWDRDRARD